jgi:hypothetical protein
VLIPNNAIFLFLQRFTGTFLKRMKNCFYSKRTSIRWQAYVLMLAIVLSVWQNVEAQRSEFGVLAGTMFYLGDLNQTKLFNFNLKDPSLNQVHFSGGFMYRYNLSPRLALKADFLFGKVSASDAGTVMANRNLSFSSPVTEFSAELELNFFELYNTTGKNRFAPYIFAGLTVFSFDPTATYNNKEYHLQSLGTEGQGLSSDGLSFDNSDPNNDAVETKKQYSLTSMAIPFGFGIKVTCGRMFTFGAEWGMRWTFTDYLDDVSGCYYDNDLLRKRRGDLAADLADRSPELQDNNGNNLSKHIAGHQRGNNTTHDAYSFAGITMTVRFGNSDRACYLKPAKRSRR